MNTVTDKDVSNIKTLAKEYFNKIQKAGDDTGKLHDINEEMVGAKMALQTIFKDGVIAFEDELKQLLTRGE